MVGGNAATRLMRACCFCFMADFNDTAGGEFITRGCESTLGMGALVGRGLVGRDGVVASMLGGTWSSVSRFDGASDAPGNGVKRTDANPRVAVWVSVRRGALPAALALGLAFKTNLSERVVTEASCCALGEKWD